MDKIYYKLMVITIVDCECIPDKRFVLFLPATH